MDDLGKRLVERYGCPAGAPLRRKVNYSIRTLPGGPETLHALETLNAARNHAHRAGANERVIATDAAIDRVEEIRTAMEDAIIRSVS